jgi:hypothetical protein
MCGVGINLIVSRHANYAPLPIDTPSFLAALGTHFEVRMPSHERKSAQIVYFSLSTYLHIELAEIAEEEKQWRRQDKSCKKSQELTQKRSSAPLSGRSEACLHAAVGI